MKTEQKTILIVDDSKVILDILEKEINKTLNVRILRAINFKEALKFILQEEIIHIAILDLNLPDAAHGEIVDYAIRKSIPSVVLTATFDDNLKQTILQKDIVDYIIKDSPDSIKNIVNIIKRTLKNYDTNVMVVEDSVIQLALAEKQFKAMKLNVHTAINGREALDLIEKGDTHYSLILTDYNMPIMDGMELTYKLRSMYKKNELAILVISANTAPEIATNFIKIGANDFISKPYTQVEFRTRVNSNLDLIDLFEQGKQQEKQLSEQSKMQSMGEMIGNIAHHWRQPLSIISTAATSMQLYKEMGTLDDNIFEESCISINNQTQFLSKVIGDFDSYIKGERILENINLKDTINHFLKLVKSSIENHHINIVLNLEENITIKSYPNELIKCFTNIFNNAKDALEKIGEDDRFLFITIIQTNNGQTIIKFRDNGGGIPANIKDKIFEPYFTTKHQAKGTGLGLHMTYDIIHNINGSIDVENITYIHNDKELKGAEFQIILNDNISI